MLNVSATQCNWCSSKYQVRMVRESMLLFVYIQRSYTTAAFAFNCVFGLFVCLILSIIVLALMPLYLPSDNFVLANLNNKWFLSPILFLYFLVFFTSYTRYICLLSYQYYYSNEIRCIHRWGKLADGWTNSNRT